MTTDKNLSKSACLIADDHGVVRRGLADLVKHKLGFGKILEAENFDEALAHIEDESLALALIDLGMPGLSEPKEMARIRNIRPDLPVAVISGSDDRQDMLECLAAGVHGYLVKNLEDEELIVALTQIMSGQIYAPPELAETHSKVGTDTGKRPKLTPRQKDVLDLLLEGRTNKEIARDLDLSESTIKIHVAALFRALGVRNRVEAVKVAKEFSS